MYPRNAASPERIAIGPVILIADGTPQGASVVVTVRGQGGAEAGSAGTIAYGATGVIVYYTPTQAETNFTSFTVIASKADCIPACVTIVTTASSVPGRTLPADGSVTAAVIADNAIDAATFAADVDAEILSYVVDDATRIDASDLNTEIDAWKNGGRLDLILDIIAADTTTDIPGTLASMDTKLDTIDNFLDTEIAAIISTLGTAGAGLTDLGGMSTTMKAQVNAEALDVLNVDTFAQPGQATPAATTTIRLMLAYLYKAWRNKTTQTATEYDLYNDDAATIDQKAATSDDATTYSRGEVATGP